MQHECKLCALEQCSLPRGARRGTQQHQRLRGEMCSQLVIRLVTQCAVRHTLDYALEQSETWRFQKSSLAHRREECEREQCVIGLC